MLDEADDDALDALAQWVRSPEQIRSVIRAGHELEAPRRRKRLGCDATGNRSEKEAGLAHRPTELVYFDLHAGDRNLVSRYKRALGCKPSSRDNLSFDAELVGVGGPHSGIIAPRPAAVHSLWKALGASPLRMRILIELRAGERGSHPRVLVDSCSCGELSETE